MYDLIIYHFLIMFCFWSREYNSTSLFWFFIFKGIGHFFETPSAGSAPGTDHSQIYAFLINNRFQAEKRTHMPVPAQSFLPA